MLASPKEARSTPQEITIDEPADLTFRTNQSQISELATGSTASSRSKPRSIQSRVLKKLASTFSLTVGTTDEDDEIKFLSERSATCILVNFISVGYILLPSGLYFRCVMSFLRNIDMKMMLTYISLASFSVCSRRNNSSTALLDLYFGAVLDYGNLRTGSMCSSRSSESINYPFSACPIVTTFFENG